MQPKDYYKILGVAETVSDSELKKAFRKIAQESHPDRHPGDTVAEERFKEASEAYEVLSNPEKRQKYDALRKYGFGEAGFGPGGGFNPQGAGFPQGVHIRFNSGNVQEMDFADIFTEGSPFSGLFDHIFDQMGAQRPGPRGFRSHPQSRANFESPDRSTEDSFFRTDGLDVHCTVWLKLEQLEKGAKVKVRTPSGKKAVVQVPSLSKIGSVLRLPGLGHAQGDRRGDQYVHLEAVA